MYFLEVIPSFSFVKPLAETPANTRLDATLNLISFGTSGTFRIAKNT